MAQEINSCDLCGTAKNIYICDRGHNAMFCKPCLLCIKINEHAQKFKAKCEHDDCNFLPFVKPQIE